MSQTFKVQLGDVIINGANGRPTMVVDDIKLRQDVTEFFTIEVLPNGFGAGLEQLIGVVEVSSDVFVSLADQQIRSGFDTFKSLQGEDARIPRSSGEKLFNVTYLTVEKDPSDPTRYWFRTNLVTEKGTQLPLAIPHSV